MDDYSKVTNYQPKLEIQNIVIYKSGAKHYKRAIIISRYYLKLVLKQKVLYNLLNVGDGCLCHPATPTVLFCLGCMGAVVGGLSLPL